MAILKKESVLISIGLEKIPASINYVGILPEKEYWTPWHDEDGEFLTKDGEVLYWNIRSVHEKEDGGYIVNWDTGENLERHLEKLLHDFQEIEYLCSRQSGYDTRNYASFRGYGDWEDKEMTEIERVKQRIHFLKCLRQKN